MLVQPYLFFDGRCEEALDFYRDALGAEVEMLMRFKDAPQPAAEASAASEGSGCADMGPPPAASADKVMHACFRIGESRVLASDGMCAGKPSFEGVALALTADDDAEAERLFAAIAEGGKVQAPMAPTFFASRFGMAADRFGVSWMVTTPK